MTKPSLCQTPTMLVKPPPILVALAHFAHDSVCVCVCLCLCVCVCVLKYLPKYCREFVISFDILCQMENDLSAPIYLSCRPCEDLSIDIWVS